MKNRLFAGSLFRLLENIIMVTISLLLTPFFIKTLGQNDYGLWLLTLSILGWFNVINLGFPVAVQRHITIAIEKKDELLINKVFCTSLFLFGFLGLISAVGLLIISGIPSNIGIPKENHISFQVAVSWLILKVIWDFLMNAFNGIYAGMLRYDIDAKISSINTIIKAILVYLLIPKYHILGAVAATLLSDLICHILKIYYAKKLFPPLKIKISLICFTELKSLFHFSKHVIASGIARTINTRSAPILVTKLFDLALVPIYMIANRLSTLAEGFAVAITGIFQPVFTKMVARNEDSKAIENMYIEVSLINITVYSVLYQSLFIYGALFTTLWVGEEFADSIPIMNILIFTFLCKALSWSAKAVLLAQANHKLLSITNLIGAIINIVGSILLSHYIGLIGIAISTAISFFITDVCFNFVLLKRYNNFNITPVIRAFILSTLLTYLLGILGQTYIMNNVEKTWFSLISIGLISFPLVLLFNWLIILNKKLKLQSLNTVKNKLKKV